VIADAVAAVRERIARAAARAGRKPDEVTLVAVSKTHPPSAIEAAFAAGVRDFGENKVQEAAAKIEALAGLRAQGLRWHLVGHLQSNKVRRAAALFDRIHSIDSADLAARLDWLALETKAEPPSVLLQVDLGGEATKSGLSESAVLPALEAIRDLARVRVIGLMTVPPFSEDPERTRPYFRQLRALRDWAASRGLLHGGELSMGMSGDYEVAIEEGATLVRVGTAIFGARPSA
jgi:pyridoxal phosphate enzyme (YggS family)